MYRQTNFTQINSFKDKYCNLYIKFGYTIEKCVSLKFHFKFCNMGSQQWFSYYKKRAIFTLLNSRKLNPRS